MQPTRACLRPSQQHSPQESIHKGRGSLRMSQEYCYMGLPRRQAHASCGMMWELRGSVIPVLTTSDVRLLCFGGTLVCSGVFQGLPFLEVELKVYCIVKPLRPLWRDSAGVRLTGTGRSEGMMLWSEMGTWGELLHHGGTEAGLHTKLRSSSFPPHGGLTG